MVKSAERILQLLELLSVLPEATGVSDVARHLGIPKSSAQALLETLAGRGYAERRGTAYVLAPALRDGGWIGGEVALMKRAAQPVMRHVVDRTGESAFLGIRLPNWQIRYIDKAVSPNEVRYDGGLAHDRPAYCTSIGHLFLAAASPEELNAYLADTRLEGIVSGTQTDPAALRGLVDEARRRGWAQSRNGHVDGASGVAAPVFDARGEMIAGLTVAAPTWRFDEGREAMLQATIAAADEITRALRAITIPDARPADGTLAEGSPT